MLQRYDTTFIADAAVDDFLLLSLIREIVAYSMDCLLDPSRMRAVMEYPPALF